jgi:hypothetical protein
MLIAAMAIGRWVCRRLPACPVGLGAVGLWSGLALGLAVTILLTLRLQLQALAQ